MGAEPSEVIAAAARISTLRRMTLTTEQDLPIHLTLNEVAKHFLRCSRSKAFVFVSDDDEGFPPPVAVVGRNRLWHRDEVIAWRDCNRPTTRNPRVGTQGVRVQPVASSLAETPAADVDLLSGFTEAA